MNCLLAWVSGCLLDGRDELWYDDWLEGYEVLADG